jgi:hypothetical protein
MLGVDVGAIKQPILVKNMRESGECGMIYREFEAVGLRTQEPGNGSFIIQFVRLFG